MARRGPARRVGPPGPDESIAGRESTKAIVAPVARVRAALERLDVPAPADLPRFVWIRLPRRRWLLVTDTAAMVGDWSTGAVIQIWGRS